MFSFKQKSILLSPIYPKSALLSNSLLTGYLVLNENLVVIMPNSIHDMACGSPGIEVHLHGPQCYVCGFVYFGLFTSCYKLSFNCANYIAPKDHISLRGNESVKVKGRFPIKRQILHFKRLNRLILNRVPAG